MKTREPADALNRCADTVAAGDAEGLRMLADLFSSSPLPTATATLTRLSKATLVPTRVGMTVDDTLRILAPLNRLVGIYGKPSLAKDFEAVTEFLRPYSQAGLVSLVDEAKSALSKPAGKPKPTLREDVVQRHLRHLEQTLGNDPAFLAAYSELDRDPDVGKLEIAELAKRFTEDAAKSRQVALKKIWARHHALMTFRAKSESRDGRSAA